MAELVDAGDLKSPGVKPVPVRFRLAAPRIPALSLEGAGIFLLFASVSATSLKIFVLCVLAKKFHLPTICQQISTKTCFARRHTAFSTRNSTHSFEAYSMHRERTFSWNPDWKHGRPSPCVHSNSQKIYKKILVAIMLANTTANNAKAIISFEVNFNTFILVLPTPPR